MKLYARTYNVLRTYNLFTRVFIFKKFEIYYDSGKINDNVNWANLFIKQNLNQCNYTITIISERRIQYDPFSIEISCFLSRQNGQINNPRCQTFPPAHNRGALHTTERSEPLTSHDNGFVVLLPCPVQISIIMYCQQT